MADLSTNRLASTAAVILSSIAPNFLLAQPGASKPPYRYLFLPVALEVATRPVVVKATDGRMHLSYLLLVSNWAAAGLRIAQWVSWRLAVNRSISCRNLNARCQSLGDPKIQPLVDCTT